MIQLSGITYESLLRSYPKSWRGNGRTDEVLAIMLEDAEARGRRHPNLSESLDVIGHGLLVRLRCLDLVVEPQVRDTTARLSLVFGTAWAMVCLIFGELSIPWLSGGAIPVELGIDLHPAGRLFMTVGGFVYLGWAAMFVSYLVGNPQAFRGLAVATLLLTCALPTVAGTLGQQRPPGELLLFFALLNLLAFLPGSAAPARSRIRAVMAASAATAFISLVGVRLYGRYEVSKIPDAVSFNYNRYVFYWFGSDSAGSPLFNARDLGLAVPYAVTAALLIAILFRRTRPRWLPAIALVSVPFVLLRLMGDLPTGYSFHRSRFFIEAGAWVAVVAVVLLRESPVTQSRRAPSV